MDDHDFKSVRKAFNIMSVLILILAYANAEINQINFLGIDISLQGRKVYIGIFILYTYFTWRYFTKLPYRSQFLNEYHLYFLGPQGVKKDFLKEEHYAQLKKEKTDKIVDLNITRTQLMPLRKLTFEWLFQPRRLNQYEIKQEVELKKIYVVKKFIWFCTKHDKFGDYIFPLIPLLANLFYFLLDKEWQGSIYNI